MSFPLGKPALALIAVAIITGAVILSRPEQPRADLELWTFAQTHADLYATLKDSAAAETGGSVNIRLIPNNALNIRLVSLFLADRSGAELPDVVEIRQDALGRYLAAPADQIGFCPLNDFLNAPEHRWIDRIVRQRFAPYTKDGRIFGLPHDVHPVTLTYRADLFAEAGVDLEAPSPGFDFVTWPDFQARSLQFQDYWRKRGVGERWALDLYSANADILAALLLQRGVNLIEPDGRLRLTDPLVADTLLFYAGMVAGPERISSDSVSGGMGVWKRDLESGAVCGLVTPDWRIADLRSNAPALVGKLRMMRLPRFAATDSPTTTWGGTMIAIPRKSHDPQRAWRLIEAIYLSPRGMTAQARDLGILPPVVEFWKDPAVRVADPMFKDRQVVNDLYAELAPKIPVQHLTPDTAYATAALGFVLTQTVGALRGGDDPATLRAKVNEWLAARQADVQRQIEHGRITPSSGTRGEGRGGGSR
jgi:arabinosaccharide transport system substrate-binding protein